MQERWAGRVGTALAVLVAYVVWVYLRGRVLRFVERVVYDSFALVYLPHRFSSCLLLEF
jgi:CHASE2 domain-containing sensor protein